MSIPRLLVALSLAAAVTLVAPQDAEACSCMPPPDITTQWGAMPGDVVMARPISGLQILGTRYYRMRVLRVYKGCMTRGAWMMVSTAASSAACGVSFSKGKSYLLAGDATALPSGLWHMPMNSCKIHTPFTSLTAEEKAWLKTRTVCCGDMCTCLDGKPPVACFVDPCMMSSCPEGTCVANYCDGCAAEWYTDDGSLACTPCATDADCTADEICSEGQCMPPEDTSCSSDADCPATQWCRATFDGGTECVDYQVEGESCGGFTPSWAVMKCSPELICTDFAPMIPDLPGTCRKPCEENGDCDGDQYCAADDTCADDGSCDGDSDCQVPGNSYEADLCLGFGFCMDDGTCGWECGFPGCADVGAIDFGPCKMSLGYGVIDGKCITVGGCDAAGYDFFVTKEECQVACGLTPTCDDLAPVWFDFCPTTLGAAVIDGACTLVSGCDSGDYTLFVDVAACEAACFEAPVAETTCEDVTGQDFGPCDMELGWAISGGACVSISGCDAGEATFFPTQQACLEGCVSWENCEPVYAAYWAAVDAAKSCTSADECVDIPGTSCGCTQNLVVSSSQDLDWLYALLDLMGDTGCAMMTTCDCPPADGFVCEAGKCGWNYL